MAKPLTVLPLITGIACVSIGMFHIALGIDSVWGEGSAGATVDSRERFYGAIFAGYGLAWIWIARQRPIPATVVRWLAGILLLGGAGRLISMAVYGAPQWFQVVLTSTEPVRPPVHLWLATADQRQPIPAATPGTPPSIEEPR